MRTKITRPLIYLVAIIVAVLLYRNFIFDDIRDTSFFYYLYGLNEGVSLDLLLRWYSCICLLFAFMFHHYKNHVSVQKANYMIRYKSKIRYNLMILSRGMLKSAVCWITIVLLMGVFKFSLTEIHVGENDLLLLLLSTLIIMTLSTLMILLDAILDSVYAFIIVNGFLLICIEISGMQELPVMQYLGFPGFLMGIRYNQNQILMELFAVCIIEVIMIAIYIRITKKKDMMR